MVIAYIALGSNLDHPGLHVQRAVDDIDSTPDICVTGVSRLYASRPVGPRDQPDYCNAAVHVETTLSPLALLDALQGIENKHGRVRSVRWGARTLDLDIILFGNAVIQSERLVVPHCQMHLRNFVVCPIADISPEQLLPDGRRIGELVQDLGFDGLEVMFEQYPWF